MISHSGIHYTEFEGAPTVNDVAVALSRIPRWCGATKYPWSVAQHSLVVADLLEAEYANVCNPALAGLAGLTHDWAEGCGFNDVAKPLKSLEARGREENMRARVLFRSLGTTPLAGVSSFWSSQALDDCDRAAAVAEQVQMLGVNAATAARDLNGDERYRDQQMPLVYHAMDLAGRFGYRVFTADHVAMLLRERFEDYVATLHALRPAASGPLSPAVAGTPRSGESNRLAKPYCGICGYGHVTTTGDNVGGTAGQVVHAEDETSAYGDHRDGR